MTRPSIPALDLDVPGFLAEAWQRRPAWLAGALPGYRCPLTPEDLAALACDEDVESRLVFETGERPWRVEHGPFDAATFAALPESGWSLLVHGVDRIVPEVGTLLEAFRFLPNWRFDDVMVSVAPPGGSVGPHVDDYDVFLVQGEGRRRWSWTDRPPADPVRIENADLRVLRSFEPDREREARPGDVLYLPPGVAHHGVAVDRCTTLSVGFRAPSRADLLAGWLEATVASSGPAARYADPGLVPPAHPGEIPDSTLDAVRRSLVDDLDDRVALARWFGATATAPRRGVIEPAGEPVDPATIRAHVAGGGRIVRAAPTRLAFCRLPGGSVALFHAGERTELDATAAPFVETLTGRGSLDAATLARFVGDETLVGVLADLTAAGLLDLD